MKKMIAMLLTVVLAMSLLAGCGNDDGSSSGSDGSGGGNQQSDAGDKESDAGNQESDAGNQGGQEEIEINFWTISLQPNFTDFFNRMIAEYEADHPGVKIIWSDFPQDQITDKLITSSAGGDSPDVVNLNTSMCLPLAAKGALLDLNAAASDEIKSVYIQPLWKSASIGDSIYAFPWYASPPVAMYNKELFEKAKMEVPKTYDEALDMAVEFYEKTGAYLFQPPQMFNLLLGQGLEIVNEEGTAAVLNNQDTYDLLNKYKAVVDEGALPTTAWGDWGNSLAMFGREELAMLSSATSSLTRIRDEAPDVYEKIDLTVPLTGSLGTVPNSVMNIVVPSTTKHQDEAVEFAAWITGDYAQLEFCKVVEIFPSTIKASEDDFFKSDMDTLEGRARAMAAESNLISEEYVVNTPQMDQVMSLVKTMGEAIYAGGDDIWEAMKTAEEDINAKLAED